MKLRISILLVLWLSFFIAQAQTNSKPGWHPILANFYQVKFTDDTTVFAIGAQGSILRSTDAGITWKVMDVETFYNGGHIEAPFCLQKFENQTIKMFCTRSSFNGYGIQLALETIDGGFTWKTKLNSFKDENGVELEENIYSRPIFECYSFKKNSYFLIYGSKMLHTINGGKTWKVINPINQNLPFWGANGRILLVSDSVFLYNYSASSYYRTTNAGATWQTTTVGAERTAFYGPRVGWNLTGSGKILKTTNAGESWTQISAAFPAQNIKPYIRKLIFSSLTNGIAIGDSGLIHHTSDGGVTWTKRFTGLKNDLTYGSFNSANVGIVVGDKGTILRTSDGGLNWTIISQGPLRLNRNGQDPLFHPVVAFDSLTYLVGGWSEMFKSTDGGNTWKKKNVPFSGWSSSKCIDNRHVWMMQGKKVFYTSDKGDNWQERSPVMPDSLYALSLSFVDSLHGWICASSFATEQYRRGYFFRTLNGGQSWEFINPHRLYLFNSVAFYNKNYGYAVGYSTAPNDTYPYRGSYKTMDGGLTWLPCSPDSGNYWCPRGDIYLIDSLRIFATSGDYNFRSEDGGAHWAYSENNGYSNIFGIGQKYIWAVNYFGGIAKSFDGGNIFHHSSAFGVSQSSFSITSISMADTNRGLVGGENYLMITTRGGNPCEMETPTLAASGNPSFCRGDSVILQSSPGDFYTWFRNGIRIPNENGPMLKVKTSGFYSVAVRLGKCLESSEAFEVKVNPEIPILQLDGQNRVCLGDSVRLISSATLGNQWLKNGLVLSGQTSKDLSITASGIYSVLLTDSLGCRATSDTVRIDFVPPPPTPLVTPAADSIQLCDGDSVLLTSSSLTGNQWLKNAVPIFSETSSTLKVKNAGVYSVEVTQVCKRQSEVKVVAFRPSPPKPTIFPAGDLSFCSGSTRQISTSANGNLEWFKDSTAIPNANQQNLVVTSTGKYHVLVRNSTGCTNTSLPKIITEKPKPEIINQPVDLVLALGETAEFTALADLSTAAYRWQTQNAQGFQNFTNGGQYSGTSTNNLTISNVNLSNNGSVFRCIASLNGCSDTSNHVTLSIVTSAKRVQSGHQISIFPNPASTSFHIASDVELIEVVVMDARAKVYRTWRQPNGNLPLDGLASGIYLVKISTLSGNRVLTLVKN